MRHHSLCRIISGAALLVAVSVPQAFSATEPSVASRSTAADQTALAVTIYNSGLGLVKDTRTLTLPTGATELRFMDVATGIIAPSVSIRSLNDPSSLTVLEQNYEYDLLSPQKLLDKYVGKEVKLFQKNPHTEREETVSATLLSNNNGPVFRIGNEITYGHPGRLIFPEVPDNLISQPTLVWLLNNSRSKSTTVEAAYLTNGITWKADYVLKLNEQDNRADLTGWVTINNTSGAAYPNASLKLVAGNVNRVQEDMRIMSKTAYRAEMAMAAPVPQFVEEGLFEYHLYTLQRPATLKENQSKQISLLAAAEIPVRKELLLTGASYYYQGSHSGETAQKQKVAVFVELENREKNHLGMPLPKGTLRVYKKDSDQALQFIGEDSIDHTPKDEKIRVKLGEAFDIIGERKQTDWKKRASDTYEAAYEIVVRNHKKDAISVRVQEPVPGDWKLLNASHPALKANSSLLEFSLPVAANGETKLTYRVQMRY